MELLNAFSQLNWWAVIFATASSFVVGFFWYHKDLFGTQWMKLIGVTEKELSNTKGAGAIYTSTAIASLLGAILLGVIMIATNTSGILAGLLLGAMVGLVFRAGTHVIHNGFAKRSVALTVIDSGHDIIALAVAGAILGIWI